jgi:hypothetical protein
MITVEEFFRQKLKEQTPFREVITLSQELITAEQGMRWGYEYAKLYAKEELPKKISEAIENIDFKTIEDLIPYNLKILKK